MEKRLFEINSINKDYDAEVITVCVEPNNYVKDIVMIDFTEFKVFLDKNDRLYYETHDCSTGQYVSKSYNMSIYDYLDSIDQDYFEEDLYEYIYDTCINWNKAADKILNQVHSTINITPKYMS